MHALTEITFPLAAAGYSILYLICGGGFMGAVGIFFLARLMGK